MARLWGRRGPLEVTIGLFAVVLGAALGFASLVPDIEFRGTDAVAGILPALSESNVSFPGEFGIVELRLVVGNCSIFVTALDPAQLQQYNGSGVRPNPQLTCTKRASSLIGPIRLIIAENRGRFEERYEVDAAFFEARSTRAWLAIPALPLLLGGSMVLIVIGFRRGVDRLKNEFHTPRERKR